MRANLASGNRFVFTRSCVLLLLAALTPSAATAQIQSGLSGYWKFDGNFTDRSPGHRDLTPAGNIAFGPGVTGQGAIFPNDATKYLSRGTDDDIYDFGASDFTIALWVNFDGLADNQIFIEKWVGPSGPGWTFAKHPDNSILFNAQSGPGGSTPPGALVSPVQSLTTGIWYHLAVVRSGSSIVMYRDNQVIAAQNGTFIGAIGNVDKPLLLALRDGVQVFPLNGRLDEVAIWSRALSGTEIGSLYSFRQMVCGCVPQPPNPNCVTQPSGFAGGDGSPGDPYQVCSPEQLDNVRNNLTAHYIQTADLDMCGATFSEPIGNSLAPFNGTYNGQHFQFVSFSLSTTLSDNTGLFGEIGSAGGIVQNVHMLNCEVTGIDRVGCLAGRVGGTIANSSAIGSVVGRTFLGLIAGELYSAGTILDVSSAGSVLGERRVGGLIGQISGGGNLQDSYSRASSTGTSSAGALGGGLIGIISNGTVLRSYSSGAVSGTIVGTAGIGGLVGFVQTATVEDSYWDVNASGLATSAGGTGKTTAEMHQQATFVGWDFVNTWSIDEGNDYPRLRSLPAQVVPGETDCANGIDDDCDSFIDCDDSDCAINLACLPPGVPAVSSWGCVLMFLTVAVVGSLRVRQLSASRHVVRQGSERVHI